MNKKLLKEIRKIPSERWHYECDKRREKGQDNLFSKDSETTYFECKYSSKIHGMKVSLIHESATSECKVPADGGYGWETERQYSDHGYLLTLSRGGIEEELDDESGEIEKLYKCIERKCEKDLLKLIED